MLVAYEPVVPVLVDFPSAIVGLVVLLQQKPRAVIETPPSEVIEPLIVADVAVMEIVVVVDKAIMPSSVLKLISFP